ncbi:MAG TPA: hypothetical protein VFI65_24915 [Streptosporangiaceae bacterium]|nr:hypothetical protein [Streptosporangiaceae bacterium]
MDQDYQAGRHRLPGYEDARISRDQGVRRVRRMSNWTAAAMVAGVAVTTGYFAHAATLASQPGSVSTGQSGQSGTTAPGHKANVTHPVATSGGSGVTAGTSGGAGGGTYGGDR